MAGATPHTWLMRAMDLEGLPPPAKLVLCAMARHGHREHNRVRCGQARIAKLTGYSERAVGDWRRALVSAGYLARDDSGWLLTIEQGKPERVPTDPRKRGKQDRRTPPTDTTLGHVTDGHVTVGHPEQDRRTREQDRRSPRTGPTVLQRGSEGDRRGSEGGGYTPHRQTYTVNASGFFEGANGFAGKLAAQEALAAFEAVARTKGASFIAANMIDVVGGWDAVAPKRKLHPDRDTHERWWWATRRAVGWKADGGWEDRPKEGYDPAADRWWTNFRRRWLAAWGRDIRNEKRGAA